jgi:TetR/AcrR family transcriptional regulator, mexJK operon transcriptional repressor
MMGQPARPVSEQPAKQQQILVGARQAFAELGYERTSVDLIAARAGVSKATLYNHFEDKKALFVACFSEEADEMRERLLAVLREPEGDLEPALQRIGEQLVTFILSRTVSCLYRQTIAEVARFPEIGRTLFERGPKVTHDALASYLRRWDEKGVLRIDDARSAAVQFVALCRGDLVQRSQLGLQCGPDEVRETVARAVRTFVRAHRA